MPDEIVQAVVDRAECARVITAIANHIDHGEFDAMADLYLDDGVLDRGRDVLRGRNQIRDGVARRPATEISRHVVSNIDVTLTSTSEAVARSYATVFKTARSTTDAAPRVAGPSTIVQYDDQLVRTSLGWRLAARRLRRIMEGG